MSQGTGDLRVGIGFDAHRFASERALVLGGVRLRDKDGLSGHSDADVLAHAVIDALVGVGCGEDIGTLFPETDPTYKGADSMELLASVARLLEERGWAVVNVDAVVICEEPRIAPHRRRMCERLAESMGIETERVSVRGTTSEGMGYTGRGEGIAAQAVALVERIERENERSE